MRLIDCRISDGQPVLTSVEQNCYLLSRLSSYSRHYFAIKTIVVLNRHSTRIVGIVGIHAVAKSLVLPAVVNCEVTCFASSKDSSHEPKWRRGSGEIE